VSDVSRSAVSLFRGREGRNNIKIMKLLSRAPLNRHQIANELGKKYNTIFDRVDDLEKEGILKVMEFTTAKYSRRPIYALDCRGLYIAALHSPDDELRRNALGKCGEMLRQAWRAFADIYEIDSDRSQRVGEWMSTDDGVRSILRHLRDPEKLVNETRMLIEYRRMIDLGIMLHRSAVAHVFSLNDLADMTEEDKTSLAWGLTQIDSLEKALSTLAEIAYHHPKLRKLYDAAKEADAPLIKRFETQVALAEETQARGQAT